MTAKEQIEALEDIRTFLHQEILAWRFDELKKKDLSYKLLYVIDTVKKYEEIQRKETV